MLAASSRFTAACLGSLPPPPPAATCTRRWPHPIHVVASQYHMHQVGASLVTQHLRDGVELAPLRQRGHWDFDYQVQSFMPNGSVVSSAAAQAMNLTLQQTVLAGACWSGHCAVASRLHVA